MFCSYCGSVNRDDALYCSSCGRDIATEHPIASTSSSLIRPVDVRLIRLLTICQDKEHNLWPLDIFEGSEVVLKKQYKTVPTWDDVCGWFGFEAVQAEVNNFIAQRRTYLRSIQEIYELDEPVGKCHKCGVAGMKYRYCFGLAEITSEKRSWIETAISAGISAISLPTVGYGIFHFPRKTTKANILRLHLSLCYACAKQFYMDVDCTCHPAWDKAQVLGFTQFLTEKQLDKFKPA